MSNLYSQELHQMFDASSILRDPVFAGDALVAKLDNGLRVKIQFTTFEMNEGCRNALTVTIINLVSGVLDVQQIKFKDIIGAHERENSLHPTNYYIISNCLNQGSVWSAPITIAQKAEIADVVTAYIANYI